MAKKGTKYKCEECGLIVMVEDPCACAPCDLMCCGAQMTEVKPATKAKPKPKTKAKPKAKGKK